MSIVGWMVIAVVCLAAGLALLLLDRHRRRPGPSPAPDDPLEPPPEDPGSLFRPNTPP